MRSLSISTIWLTTYIDATIREKPIRTIHRCRKAEYSTGEKKRPPGRSRSVAVIQPRMNIVHTGARSGILKRKKQSRIFFSGCGTRCSSCSCNSMNDELKIIIYTPLSVNNTSLNNKIWHLLSCSSSSAIFIARFRIFLKRNISRNAMELRHNF